MKNFAPRLAQLRKIKKMNIDDLNKLLQSSDLFNLTAQEAETIFDDIIKKFSELKFGPDEKRLKINNELIDQFKSSDV